MVLKSVSPPLLRRFGFRRILLSNTAIVAIMMMGLALVQPGLRSGRLWVGSWCSASSLAAIHLDEYAGLCRCRRPEISTATGVASVIQQLAAGFGVAISATVLGQFAGPGQIPDLADFQSPSSSWRASR